MTEQDTPLALVKKWQDKIPDCYDKMDLLKSTVSCEWPDWCDVPIAAGFAVLSTADGAETQESYQYAAAFCAGLTACYTWRKYKIIYSFDAELAGTLAAQADDIADTDVLPTELLYRIPYPCVYLKAPDAIEEGVDGAFVWLEYDVNRQAGELRVQLYDAKNVSSFPLVLHLLPEATLGECIADTWEEARRHLSGPVKAPDLHADDFRHTLRALQLLLYVLSAQADVRENPIQHSITRHSPQIKDKFREIELQDVGVIVGQSLRMSCQSQEHAGHTGGGGQGVPHRPHFRRGHWHHYWIGPMEGKRELSLRWTAPTMIHPDAGESLPHVTPVK